MPWCTVSPVTRAPSDIRVEVSVLGETLILRVINTIARDKAIGHTGIGLANVRERLEVQFGERARFTAGPVERSLMGGRDPHAACCVTARTVRVREAGSGA